MSERERIAQLDRALLEIVKDFLLLSPLSWPKQTMQVFLKGAKRGNPKLPVVEYPQNNYQPMIDRLDAYLMRLGSDDHPAIAYLRATAGSYRDAYCILQGVGTSDVSDFSRRLYGSPRDPLTGYTRCNLDVARYFLRVMKEYHVSDAPSPNIYSASKFKHLLESRLHKLIDQKADPISIQIDSDIAARATAGPNYVKIRKGAHFSANDVEQLLHHEIMVHTLTYLNGRKQPVLKMLGYNAPRTTATQEGLAVFAEYINMTLEPVRLKRIALRILAIDMAEQGADFIELFRFFESHGQDAEESYQSTMRIFRGGRPEGGVVFYKDNVYLRGLVEVGSFLKRAMHQGWLHDVDLLFCGKLTTQDILQFKPLLEEGYIADPVYMPNWAKNSGELAAHLAINDLTERFRLKKAKKT